MLVTNGDVTRLPRLFQSKLFMCGCFLMLLCCDTSPLILNSEGSTRLRTPATSVRLTAQEFYSSGAEFLRTCSAVDRLTEKPKDTDLKDARACQTYVAGVADGVALQHIWSRSRGDKTTAAFCVTFGNVPSSRLVDAVLQYLRDNPDRQHFHASIAVEEVLHHKFPCP